MSKVLIAANPDYQRDIESSVLNMGNPIISVSEFFADTIQGEGVNAGIPSIFLRLQDCTLNCIYCDSESVWRYGNPYTVQELLNLLDENECIEDLVKGTHLIFTGGSPLRQQFEIEAMMYKFEARYNFMPYIEVENECTLVPSGFMRNFVRCWNNSPKLEASQNSKPGRYKPMVLKVLSDLPNSWFKFVVTKSEDWEEIEKEFLIPKLIKKEQIILMPEGETRDRLQLTRELTIALAVEHGVRYSDRLHIIAWNKKTGV